jgi:hypothetical protein
MEGKAFWVFARKGVKNVFWMVRKGVVVMLG